MSIDLTGADWRKSTRSSAQGNCVEVASNLPGIVAVRDSKDPNGGALALSPAAFAAFGELVKAGKLNA